jgi:hypothetical protein
MTAAQRVLTAEVHVLQVSGGQVTLSAFRQLDWVDEDRIEPFGRVTDPLRRHDDSGDIHVIGRERSTNSLVRSMADHSERRLVKAWEALPLIVLAGR